MFEQKYFLRQFAERSLPTPTDNATGTMTTTRTIEGSDQDKTLFDFDGNIESQNLSKLAATGTFTDSIEGVDQDINRFTRFI